MSLTPNENPRDDPRDPRDPREPRRDEPARAAAEHLFEELRDECSEVGINGRGMNVTGFERGVRAFTREAKRLGASIERTLVLLKDCLRDQRLPQEDRDIYQHYVDSAVRWAIDAYYGPAV